MIKSVCNHLSGGILFFVLILHETALSDNLFKADSSFETETSTMIASRVGDVRWELDPSEAYDDSQSVKLIFNSYGRTYSKPFKITKEQSGKPFTFSIYAKADRDNVPAQLYMLQENYTGICGQKFLLSKNWNRYSVTGILEKGEYYFCLELHKTATVWGDAFQLEESSKESKYKNNVGIHTGIFIPADNDSTFFKNATIPILITATGLSSYEKLKHATLLFSISDHWKNTIYQNKFDVSSDNGRFKLDYNFIPPRLGWYSANVQLFDANKLITENSSSFVVIDKPVPVTAKIPFCGIVGPRFPGMIRSGCSWVEAFCHWSEMEPAMGQYKWKDFSSIHKQNLKAKLVLAHLPSAPSWAWNTEDVADCKKIGIKQPTFGFLPSDMHMESWRKFVHELAVHYKDQVDIIEIGGEDNLTFGTNPYYLKKYHKDTKNGYLISGPAYEKYAEMVKIACEEIRKANPDVKIGIIRPGGDTPNYTFSSPVIKKCGSSFDFFPLDCYCYPRYIGPGQPETAFPEDFLPEYLSNALKTCKINGNGQHVYISEIGYALDYTVKPDSVYAMEMVKRLPRMFLVARMTGGVEILNWFSSNFCIEGGKYHYGLWRFGMPLPSVPAYSAVARIVENVENSKELILGGDSKAVVFKKDGRSDAAVWFVRGSGKLKLKEIPEGLAVSDVMGNSVHIENPSFLSKIFNSIDLSDSSVFINIGEFPVYFGLEGNDSFEKLVNILSKSMMICEPVRTSFSTPRKDKGILQLKNIAGKDIDGVVTIGGSVKNLSLKNGEAINIEVPVNKNNIDVSVDCGENYEKVTDSYQIAFESCPGIDFKGKIDADLSKWNGRPFIAMNERSQIMPPDPWIDYKGPEQFSAKVYTGWDDKYFYMAVEVKDESHNNRFPGQIYKGDCIQFAFDPLANGGTRGYGKDDKELGIALIDNKAAIAEWTKNSNIWKSSEYAVKRDEKEKKTFYEMRIPFAILGIPPKKGSAFGFNFVIFNDDTGAGANYYYQLAPGITGGKNPAMFRKFVLE